MELLQLFGHPSGSTLDQLQLFGSFMWKRAEPVFQMQSHESRVEVENNLTLLAGHAFDETQDILGFQGLK